MTLSSDPWDAVRSAIEAGSSAAVAGLVGGLTPGERRRVADELPGYWRGLGDDQRWNRALGIRVAGAGCLNGSAAVATWIMRRDLRNGVAEVSVQTLMTAIAARSEEWRTDLGRRLVARLNLVEQLRGWEGHVEWRLASELIRLSGAPTPQDDAFVAGWVAGRERDGPVEDDPWFAELAPRLFEVDGLGGLLAQEFSWDEPSLLLAVARHPDRAAVLDGLAARFLRGGSPGELRWFVKLHETMQPGAAERAARLRDYVRMLPSASGAVAELAFRQVKLADEAEPLPASLFDEAAESLMFRPEKKIVRATLIWLARTVKTHDRAAATVRAACVGFGHEDLDLRDRAVRLAAAHLTDPAEVRAAVAGLPTELRGLLGFGSERRSTGSPPSLPPAPAITELAAPIGSAAELVEAVAAYLGSHRPGWVEGERLLAGLVGFGPSAVAELETVVRGVRPWILVGEQENVRGTNAVLRALIHRAARSSRRRLSMEPKIRCLGVRPDRPGPELVTLGRFDEAAHRLGEQRLLLATPTHSTGHLDQDVLVERLKAFERAGLEPGPRDLEQALLRLPHTATAGSATAALRSPAGRALHARLADGLPEPVITLGWPGVAAHWPAGSDTARALGDIPYREPEGPVFHGTTAWWPSTLPSHPDLVAAHLLAWTDRGSATFAPTVAALARTEAPAGRATAAVMLTALAGARPEDRVAGAGALLARMAYGSPSAEVLGECLAERAGEIKLNRLAATVTEVIRAGADLWPMFRAALPALLPVTGERPRAGLADLIAAATLNAELFAVRDTVPGLRSVTSRSGSSRLVREAARLQSVVVSQ